LREKSPIVLFWSMALILASLATSVAAAEVTLEGGINGSLGDDVSSSVARAIDYVLSCQNDDGGFGNGIGKPSDQRETSEAAMALALAGGLDRATKGDVLGYLAANPPSTNLSNYAGNLGRYMMGVVAAGGNPYDLGGVNYVELLKAEARKGHNSNFFSEAYVPLGLAAAGEPDCIEAQGSIAYLKEKQGTGGNWVGVDATGLVICAMIACGEDPSSESIQRAVSWFELVQNEDGGFPADHGGASNSNSEILAIMAIYALGEDPATWAKNGQTPVDHLLSLQKDNGQIWWLPDNEGFFPIQCTAFGAIALGGEWLPTAVYEGEASSNITDLNLKIMSASQSVPGLEEGLGYILSCQNPDGGFAEQPGGESDLKLSADAAVALAQTDSLDRASKGDLLGYLVANAPDESVSSGNLGRYVMGLVAAGGRPYDVNGVDYVERLRNAKPINQLFADSLILMGLTAAGEADSALAQALITTFSNGQAANGGWGWSPGGSDVDTTGMVVSALVSSGTDPGSELIQGALTYLHSMQDDATGGFSMGNGMSSDPNTNSCGLAIMAINAGGQNASDWVTSSGRSPLDFMLTCQQNSGVFWWKPDAAGSFLLEGTAYGVIGMDGGWMPSVVYKGRG